MTQLYALGIGRGTQNTQGQWLEVFYPAPLLNPPAELAAAILNTVGAGTHAIKNTEQGQRLSQTLRTARAGEQAAILDGFCADLPAAGQTVICALPTDSPPADVPTAYLKLQLISHRLVRPHGTNLEGIFATLPNVAWTNEGAIDAQELPARQHKARAQGTPLQVQAVDKFPRMTDYVMPSGVRIGDARRVRLGAYLGAGTTVMHEGFVNFNAGTEGPNMVEGRISAGVFIGAGSDLGGGCSIMGTLSGGGELIISVSKDCLIGANAGLGIPLGDRCTIEAGLYLTAGTKVQTIDTQGRSTGAVKAKKLANQSDLLFRRNSLNGTVECLPNRAAIALNKTLHQNN